MTLKIAFSEIKRYKVFCSGRSVEDLDIKSKSDLNSNSIVGLHSQFFIKQHNQQIAIAIASMEFLKMVN